MSLSEKGVIIASAVLNVFALIGYYFFTVLSVFFLCGLYEEKRLATYAIITAYFAGKAILYTSTRVKAILYTSTLVNLVSFHMHFHYANLVKVQMVLADIMQVSTTIN